MLYVIDKKCYVNIAPSIYVEVAISKDGKITPTDKKVEVNAGTKIQQTTLEDWLKNFVEIEPSNDKYEMGRKYNRRKK